MLFKVAYVWDISQTEPLPGVEPVELSPPRAASVEGDSHAALTGPLEELATELGYGVRHLALDGPADGWCDTNRREIAVNERLAPNAQVRVLVHELVHALGVGYEEYGRARAEIVVDAVAHIVLAGAGLDVSAESVSYLACWGGEDAAATVRDTAELIDRLARRIEQAIATGDEEDGRALERAV